jgi:tetratricopeptide (TPR) repeat protein
VRKTARQLGYGSHSEWSDYESGRRVLPRHRVPDVIQRFGGDAVELDRLVAAAIGERESARLHPRRRAGIAAMRLPPLEVDFVERPQLYEAVVSKLRAHGRVVLAGIGGAGKSAAALELLQRASDLPVLWWIDAGDRTSTAAQLEALSAAVGAEGPLHIPTLAARVNHLGGGLIVYDDAGDPEALADLIPDDAKVDVLITTRRGSWSTWPIVEVGPFERHEGLEYVLARFPAADESEAMALADRLGCLPLALALASSYASSSDIAIEAYARQAVADASATWELSLGAAEPAAQAWTAVAAFLAPSAVPRRLFKDHADLLPAALRGADLDLVASGLERFHLVRPEGPFWRIHPLVHEAMRARLSSEEAVAAAGTASRLVGAELTEGEDLDPTDYTVPDWILPSVLAVGANPTARDAEPAIVARALYEAGNHAMHHFRPFESRRFTQQAADLIAARGLNDAALRFDVFNLLGVASCSVGELDSADEMFDAAMDAVRGDSRYPRRVAVCAMNKGVAAAYRGDILGALNWFQECLAAEEQRLGPDDLGLAGLLANISGMYVEVGQYDEAVRAAQRAIDLYAEEPTRNNVYMAALTNLGEALVRQGALEKARAALEHAIEFTRRQERSPGMSTIAPLRALGEIERREGNYDAAEAVLRQAIDEAEAFEGDALDRKGEVELELARLELDRGRRKAAALWAARAVEHLSGDSKAVANQLLGDVQGS